MAQAFASATHIFITAPHILTVSDPPVQFFDRVRKPAYTGENRCVPCTIVNVTVALVASAFAALVAVPLAAAVFVLSLAVIYLRGYLVPGTPALTERYLPDRVLSVFDAHSIEETRRDGESWDTVEKLERQRENAVDPEQFLVDGGAVGPCEHEDDLCLTDEFARLVDHQSASSGVEPIDRETMAGLFDAEPGTITVLEREYPALEIGRRVRKWPSEAALVTDIVTNNALRELTDRWLDVPPGQRLGILESLRSFHETCPRCSGEISLSEGTVESCCRTYDVLSIGCVECEEPLLEFDPEDIETRETETGIQP